MKASPPQKNLENVAEILAGIFVALLDARHERKPLTIKKNKNGKK